MKVGADREPQINDTARALGVRVGGERPDVVVAASGVVLSERGGMSASPPPPENLAEHRRPEEYGGFGKDPVWELETDSLPSGLTYRLDPKDPSGHGFIEPSEPMQLDAYKALLSETKSLWEVFKG